MTARTEVSPVVRVLSDRSSLGRAAGADIAAELRTRLVTQDRVRMVFAAAPSQQETLDQLRTAGDIDWSRVTAFHMDEYLGLAPEAPQRFARWLRRVLFDHVPLSAHLLEPDGDPQGSAERYAELLDAAPIDLVCLGIGVNGHLAFNDPPDAELGDPVAVRIVQMEERSRIQQVEDGSFASIDDVPIAAVTLTIPRLLAADRLFCVVPGRNKRDAVRAALHDPVSGQCPATALRTHPDCTLYLDQDSDPDAD